MVSPCLIEHPGEHIHSSDEVDDRTTERRDDGDDIFDGDTESSCGCGCLLGESYWFECIHDHRFLRPLLAYYACMLNALVVIALSLWAVWFPAPPIECHPLGKGLSSVDMDGNTVTECWPLVVVDGVASDH